MSTTTETDLRSFAEKDLSEANLVMGLPAVVVGWDVSGEGFWDGLADRAKKALDRARGMPGKVRAQAAQKIRDAARWGLNKASEASDEARNKLGAVAATAGVLALGPGILFGLVVFAVIEGSGWGGKVRRSGRRYVARRAREYGVY